VGKQIITAGARQVVVSAVMTAKMRQYDDEVEMRAQREDDFSSLT